MIGGRTDFSLTATVQTPLHIGTGTDTEVKGLGRDGEAVKVAQVHVDCNGYPSIPGSGIKGVLANYLGEDPELFGGKVAGSFSEMLRSGKVIFWPGEMISQSAQAYGPHNGTTVPTTNHKHAAKPLFIEVNIAIDPEAGVAQAGRLFYQQMVAPGTQFKLKFSAADGVDEANLAKLFAELCNSDGISFGRGTKGDLGRVQVDLDTLVAKKLRSTGIWDVTSQHWQGLIASKTPRTQHSLGRLYLSCDGPYLIADPSNERQSGDTETAQIAARSDHRDQALLSGTTLLGALRAGFSQHLAKTGMDGRDDKDRVCKDQGDAKNLSPSERIFGVTGWKGLFSVRGIASTGSNVRQSIKSVKLDRFSNAPIDNALYATEAWVAPAFEVRLEYNKDRGEESDLKNLLEFLKTLEDPIWGGLRLGHGTNKGFGWFTVEFERGAA